MDPERSREPLERFLDSGVERHTLGLVYGRRRIGKSTLLEHLARERSGFYFEATRGEPAVHLARLGAALGEQLGVGRLSLATWEEAFSALLRFGEGRPVPVVLDEFGYVLEAEPSVDTVLASALGPAGQGRNPGRTRLLLCGSALAMMRALTTGEAALRGRAGLELVMRPFGFREAAGFLPAGTPRELAVLVWAVVGGVIGYMTDVVDHDLPSDRRDFDRWVATRVVSPAATLRHEAATLLSEDPTLAAGSPTLLPSILGAIANGSVTAGRIANRLRRTVSNLDPSLKRLISAGFVLRHEDPLRGRRPTYALADPFLQFHYAVLEPHGPLFRDRDPRLAWERLSATFDARVRGPVFEEQARDWVRRHADPSTLGGMPDRVGPSTVVASGKEYQLDVVAATGPADRFAAESLVLALGEAKAGRTMDPGDLRRLERARAEIGARAAGARLLLFAPGFAPELLAEARRRPDAVLVDLDRLYGGS